MFFTIFIPLIAIINCVTSYLRDIE